MRIETTPEDRAASAAPSDVPKLLFPFLDLKAQFAHIRADVIAAVTEVLESQLFILGSEVEELEREVAGQVGCTFAIGCASGSDALLLALMALRIGLGDEVITTPFTFVATAGSIARLGARPIFVDINWGTYNLNVKQLADVITARTKAIMPVHLFGLPADMDPILEIAKQKEVVVIEDVAQAIGAQYRDKPVGSLGTFGCFSFFPSKNLGGAGDGGLVTTDDATLADRLKLLRVHGSRRKYEYEILGMNSRLDALQAAVLRVKLRHLGQWTAARQRNADRYRALFGDCGCNGSVVLPAAPPDREHIYNQFVIRARQRDKLREYLRRAGIPTEVYYPFPLHLQRAFAYLGYKQGDFPEAESACREVLALPIFPELTEGQQQAVVGAIADFYQQKN